MNQKTKDPCVLLAVASYEHYVKTGERIRLPKDLPEWLTDRKAGAFVTLHMEGNLRGCIGTIFPTQDSLAEEIIENAISAAAYDPRFLPVTEKELARITCSVDVLMEPEDITSLEELDPSVYGVIVSDGKHRRGLLLPMLEGIDTAEEQVAIARRKAGIRPGEAIHLQRFQVVRHQ